ncbi:lipopolysaccharide-modifying protein [Hyaloraphidium curvatum]|nr:lipopolysaccharide-modifying protein [Hyaloraphidium curvatum]
MPPWSAKDSTLVWRGATTGGFTSNSTCKEHHRHIGRALGSKVPNITFDVGFSSIALCQNCAYIGQRYGPSRGRIAFRDHFRAKYLLDMDGNSYSQRFELFLFGDSLGIRAGVHEAWYEGWIRPWEHYVPLRVDFSDLEEKLRWLAEHDDVARRIARNGQRTAWRRMRTADKQCYLSRLFLEYGHIGEELYYDV